MSGLCPCEGCSRPRHDGWGCCGHHAWLLERSLAEVAALTVELDVQLSRQTAGPPTEGGRSTERPLPFDVRSSETGWVLRNALTGWVRDLQPDPARHPHDTLPALAAWLLARHDELVTHAAADQAVGEITAAVAEAWRSVDRRPDKVFIGRCACGHDVTASVGATVVRCRECDRPYDVAESRDHLREAMRGQLVTAAEAADLAHFVGIPGNRDRVRTLVNVWAHRKQITAHGRDPEGNPRYPFGDLIDRLTSNDTGRTAG